MSKRYKTILFVRFLGYFIFLTGVLSFLFELGPVLIAETSYRMDQVFKVKREIVSNVNPVTKLTPGESEPTPGVEQGPSQSFGSVTPSENTIIPVSTDFGIVIEKINANAKIVADVDPSNERQYVKALSVGVAEALGSTPPGVPGNLYLFSHSTDAPWNIVRFNAIFYLLRELTPGDRVIIFYQNKRFDYIVFDKQVVSPTDVSYLTNRYDSPVLTLQTCDPPGTLINRLIVRARLVTS